MKIDHLPGALRPEYIFRPSQFVRRLLRTNRTSEDRSPKQAIDRLPWGMDICYHPTEVIGQSIWKMGIFELPICEVLWCLLTPGAHALDIGANIGQMTSLMAARVGSGGSVTAFEPHPEVYQELKANVARWQAVPTAGRIDSRNVALSNVAGQVSLHIADDFMQNRGTSSLESAREGSHMTSVTALRLDDLLGELPNIDLIKIDVEGHELSVFEGAGRFLEKNQNVNIIFEEHLPYPSPVTRFLEEQGYKIYCISASFSGLILFPACQQTEINWSRDYLATRDPEKYLARISKRGWEVLRNH